MISPYLLLDPLPLLYPLLLFSNSALLSTSPPTPSLAAINWLDDHHPLDDTLSLTNTYYITNNNLFYTYPFINHWPFIPISSVNTLFFIHSSIFISLRLFHHYFISNFTVSDPNLTVNFWCYAIIIRKTVARLGLWDPGSQWIWGLPDIIIVILVRTQTIVTCQI